MDWFTRLYDRRIINVNVNIIVAGIVAIVITVGIMHLADRSGLVTALANHVPDLKFDLIGRHFMLNGRAMVVSGLTFIVDLAADVGAYYLLHWLANHMPRRTPRPKSAYADLTFMRDATLVQFERALLSPILYIVALGLQNNMLHRGYSIELSTAAGFALGIFTTRLMHTLWMIHVERQAGRRSAADIVGPDPHRTTPDSSAGSPPGA